jgi:hypothetical protein
VSRSLRTLNAWGGGGKSLQYGREMLLDCEERQRNYNILGFKVHGLGLGHV